MELGSRRMASYAKCSSNRTRHYDRYFLSMTSRVRYIEYRYSDGRVLVRFPIGTTWDPGKWNFPQHKDPTHKNIELWIEEENGWKCVKKFCGWDVIGAAGSVWLHNKLSLRSPIAPRGVVA